jgi:hypothetical protein
MEFAGKADEMKAADGKKERVIPFDKKATVCGDCVVLEDIEKEPVAPVDRLLIPSDIVEIKDDDEAIYILGTREGKVTKIRGLENVKQLKVCFMHTCSSFGTVLITLLTSQPNQPIQPIQPTQPTQPTQPGAFCHMS